MTSMPSNLPFTVINKNIANNTVINPATPGAYLLNSSYGAFPIFCSIADFAQFGMNDADNSFLVMPGYYVASWSNTHYSGTGPSNFNNNNGANIVVINSVYPDTASSCKLYYNVNGTDTEITISGIS